MTRNSRIRMGFLRSIQRIPLNSIETSLFLVHFKSILPLFNLFKLTIIPSISHRSYIQATYLKVRFT